MSDSASPKCSTELRFRGDAREISSKRFRYRLAPAKRAPRSSSEKLMSKPMPVTDCSLSLSISEAITRRSHGKRPNLAMAASSTAAMTTRPLVCCGLSLTRWRNCRSTSACSILVRIGTSARPAICSTWSAAKKRPENRPMRNALTRLSQRQTRCMLVVSRREAAYTRREASGLRLQASGQLLQ